MAYKSKVKSEGDHIVERIKSGIMMKRNCYTTVKPQSVCTVLKEVTQNTIRSPKRSEKLC